MGILLDMFEEARDIVKTVNEECGINDIKEVVATTIKDVKNDVKDFVKEIVKEE